MSSELIVKNDSYDKDLMAVLRSSLYPGIEDKYIDLVLSYCKAHKIDPLLKPVHLVPMSVQDKKTGKYNNVVTLMAGINLYRIKADMTGLYAGITEPIFGPMVETEINGVIFKHPEWCKIAVKKIVNGIICEFWATEYWDENYATKSKSDSTPNYMWQKRYRGQLAKCAEAQALRKAFPGIVPSAPTYEEMQGKVIFGAHGKSTNAALAIDNNPMNSSESLELDDVTNKLIDLISRHKIEPKKVNEWVSKAGASDLYSLNEDIKFKIINYIESKVSQKEAA